MKNFILDENSEDDIDFDKIDFSDVSGNFRDRLSKGVRKAIVKRKKRFAPKQTITVGDNKIIVDKIDKIILDDKHDSKGIGYYEGKRLKELVFTINNEGLIDFEFDLFSPTMMQEYERATGLNLNDKIDVAGIGELKYSDVMFGMLANPMLIPNARISVSGTNASSQLSQSFKITNKGMNGYSTIKPINLSMLVDIYQVDANIVTFDMFKQLGRAYVPDGMDTIRYKVLAGNTVTMVFYYKQFQIKKFFFPETRDAKIL